MVLDAASVPATTSPLTLAPSPPSAAPGAALQLANGTSVGPSGQLTGASPQRADVAGTTAVQLALGFLPPEFAAANCSCFFLNASLVAELEASAAQARLSTPCSEAPFALMSAVCAAGQLLRVECLFAQQALQCNPRARVLLCMRCSPTSTVYQRQHSMDVSTPQHNVSAVRGCLHGAATSS